MVKGYLIYCSMYPNSVKSLIDNFRSLPGIGYKTAERLAFSMVNFDKEKLSNFADSIVQIRDSISRCTVCGNICDGDICTICSDNTRSKDIIFVVERPKDIVLFEKLGVYKGVYHVLGGLISPLDGVGPEDINLSSLIDRLTSNSVNEVILALKPSIEGETTMQYISKVLSSYGVKISKIATGVPIGTDMEYIDSLTLELAIDERKNIV